MYIKISNDGILDVVKACSMLGASVKNDSETAIGMFGSGLKYALAEACRIGITVYIASGTDIFETFVKEDVFRCKTFSKVCLRNIHTEQEYETPITTNFGMHDWQDPWFVYRELVCNAKDEEGYSLTKVNNIRKNISNTSIYIPYMDFKEYFDNDKKYFSNTTEDFIRPGTGIIYKRGVRIGVIQELKLDMQYQYISISESRQMNDWSARWAVGYLMGKCTDDKIWESFMESENFHEYQVNIENDSNETTLSFVRAMRNLHGEFALSTSDENIKKDLKTAGVHAFVMPTSWRMPEFLIPSYKDKIRISEDLVRDPNENEKKLIDWAFNCCKIFQMNTDVVIKVFDDSKVNGYADFKGNQVWISSLIFSNRKKLLTTILEEVGHTDSGANDYTREFTEFFINKIADFYIG